MDNKVYRLSFKEATKKMIKLSLTSIVFLVFFVALMTIKYYRYNDPSIQKEHILKTLSTSNLFIATEKYELINEAKVATYNLFKTEDKSELKDNVTLEKIEESRSVVENLDDGNTKNKLLKDIDIAKRLFIDKNLHKLKINYISQNLNKVYNGCEAASMLMALKYKGYLGNTTLYEFADEMPKSDDPNDGFYLDIFEMEPQDESHWIAPEPLINYAKEKSGYDEIYNTTGYELNELADEVLNDNPVIIYVTSGFGQPYNYSDNGVPSNLHVVLLSGYNPVSKEYYIVDPWTGFTGKYEYIIAEEKLNDIYTKVGKKSVVVK